MRRLKPVALIFAAVALFGFQKTDPWRPADLVAQIAGHGQWGAVDGDHLLDGLAAEPVELRVRLALGFGRGGDLRGAAVLAVAHLRR